MDIIIVNIYFLGIILAFFIYKWKTFDYNKKQNCINNFEHYMITLDYFLMKAFDIIYKDRILIYSIEATKLNDDQFAEVSKDFGKLVLKMLGPNLVNEYIDFYGNEDTFLFNITEYFNTRFEEDEIRKGSINNLMENEQLDEEEKVSEKWL